MVDPISDLAISTVATAPSPPTSGPSVTVASGEGARFPSNSAGFFMVSIWPAASTPTPANTEIALVINGGSDVLFFAIRNYAGILRTVAVGDQIAATITAKMIEDLAGLRSVSRGLQVIRTGFSQVYVGDYEVVAGTYLEIEPDGVLEVS